MPEHREEHGGKTISIGGDDTNPTLTIDGQEVEVVRDEDVGRFTTLHLPYTSYETVLELAKQVIDNVPDFRTN